MPYPFTDGEILTADTLNNVVTLSGGEAGPDSAGPTSGTTPLNVTSITVPEPLVAGRVHVWVTTSATKTVSTDRFILDIVIDGNICGRIIEAVDGTLRLNVAGFAVVDGTGTVPVVVQLTRTVGTGTATVGAGAQGHNVHWLFVPGT